MLENSAVQEVGSGSDGDKVDAEVRSPDAMFAATQDAQINSDPERLHQPVADSGKSGKRCQIHDMAYSRCPNFGQADVCDPHGGQHLAGRILGLLANEAWEKKVGKSPVFYVRISRSGDYAWVRRGDDGVYSFCEAPGTWQPPMLRSGQSFSRRDVPPALRDGNRRPSAQSSDDELDSAGGNTMPQGPKREYDGSRQPATFHGGSSVRPASLHAPIVTSARQWGLDNQVGQCLRGGGPSYKQTRGGSSEPRPPSSPQRRNDRGNKRR